MAYNSKAIANEFLKIGGANGAKLTPMKLQKLVYYAHAWCLAIKKRPLINERIEAWKFGPVVPSLYHAFKAVGAGAIDSPATELTFFGKEIRCFEPSLDNCDSAPEDVEFTRQLLESVWKRYGKYTALQLSEATHQPGTPWHQVRMKYGDVLNVDIPDDTIREYFEGIVAKRRANT